jgi:hypothetical protein
MTWALWHHLFHCPAHPVFQRTLLVTPVDSRITRLIIGTMLLVGALTFGVIWTLFVPLKFSIPILLLMVMAALSSCYVVVWMISISVTIVRERESHTYELLCLTPSGALGVNWAMCAASLHRADALGWIELFRRLLNGLLLLILLMVLLTTAFRENTSNVFHFLTLFVDILLLATVLYVEHVQSIVLGCIVGVLMATYSRSQMDVRFSATGTFLTLQVISLVVSLLIVSNMHSVLASPFSVTSLSLLAFYLLREGLILALWKILAYELNANPWNSI